MKWSILFSVLLYIGTLVSQIPLDCVVTLQGDTLFGKVIDRKTGFRDQKFKAVKYRGEGLPKKFKPHQILSYTANERVFVSFCVERRGVFDQQLHILQGKANEFLHKEFQQGDFILFNRVFNDEDGIESVPYCYLVGQRHMVRATQGVLGLKRAQLATYFHAYPLLVNQIQDKSVNSVADLLRFFIQTNN